MAATGARDRSVGRVDLLPRALPVGGDHHLGNLVAWWNFVTTDHGQEMKQLANKSIIAEFAAVNRIDGTGRFSGSA